MIYAVAIILQKHEGTQIVTSGTLSTRIAASPDEAKGSALTFALESKPGFAVLEVMCLEVKPQPETDQPE